MKRLEGEIVPDGRERVIHYQNHGLGSGAHRSGRTMGQRNVERHLGGELKEGYLSVEESRTKRSSFSLTERKQEKANRHESTITRSSQSQREEQRKGRSLANWAKARRWSCCCTMLFVKLLACTYDRGAYAIKRVRDTRKKTPRRWEIAARGGCS